MAEILKTTFLLRRGLAEAWERNNPVLSCGEPGFVIDQNKLKIGDGQTAWNDLDYLNELYVADNESVIVNDNIIRLFGFEAAEIGARPQKGENGQLEWVIPTIDSVEEIAIELANLQKEVTQISETVDKTSEELKSYVDKQIENVEVKSMDGGVIE